MTRKQDGALSWLKLLAPLAFFLFSLAVWGGRLENKLETEIIHRQQDYNTMEYIRRQNEQVLLEVRELKTDVKWLRERF